MAGGGGDAILTFTLQQPTVDYAMREPHDNALVILKFNFVHSVDGVTWPSTAGSRRFVGVESSTTSDALHDTDVNPSVGGECRRWTTAYVRSCMHMCNIFTMQ